MKNILLIVLCLVSVHAFAQKHSFMLSEVHSSKYLVHYYYQDGNDLFVASYQKEKKGVSLKITKNKKAYFSLIRGKGGKLYYTLSAKTKPVAFTKKSYNILPQELRIFLAYQEADQQQFQPPFGGDVTGGVNNGIPNVLGADDSTTPGGSGEDCTQMSSCSCGNSSVVVSCRCGGVISCYERTTMACDLDAAGNKVNCREVTGCAGRCD